MEFHGDITLGDKFDSDSLYAEEDIKWRFFISQTYLETYLQEHIQRELLLENKQHVVAYSHLSLDQPLTSEGEDDFCLYDALADASFDGFAAVEARIMAEQFLDSLSRQERRLVHMLQEGCLLSSIAEELNLTEDEITAMGSEIGRKRKAFYDVN